MQSLPVEVGSSSSSSATHSGPEVQVVFPVAQTSVLDSLNQQREDGRLCDLSIHVQGHVFKAHRCVLAASSPYFHDQVLLKNMSSVSIPAVMDPLAFESVLRCAYTGQLRMLRDDIVNYLTVGSVLQMWHIVDKCTELLKDGRAAASAAASTDRAGVGASSDNPGCSSSNGEGSAGRGSSCDQMVGSNQHQSAAQPSSRPAASESQSPSSTNYFSPRDGSSFAGSGTAGGRAAAEGGGPSNTPSYCTPSGGEEAFLIEEEEDEEDEEVLFQQKKRARGSAKRKKTGSASEQVVGVSDSFGVSSYQGGEERSAVPQKRSTFSHPNIVPRKQWVMVKTEHPEDDDLIVVSGEEVGEEDDEEDEERDLDLAREKARDFNICNVRSLSGEPSNRAEPDLDSQLDYCPSSEDYLKFDGSLMDQALAQHIHDSATNQSASRAVTALLGQVQSAAGARAQLFPLDMQGNKILLYSQASGLPVDATPPALEMSGGLIGGSPFKGPGLEHGAVHVSLQSGVAGECESGGVGGAGGSGSGKVFMCHCGKTFTHRSMRDRHINMHLDLRPFHCPVCAKKFKMKHHLTEHMKTHTGLKPYDCGSCGKKFMWRDSFMRHRSHCERRGGLAEAGDSGGGGGSSDPGRAAGEEGAGLMPSPHHHLLSPGEGSSRGGLPLSSPLLTAQHAAPSGGNAAATSTGPILVGSSTQGLFDSLGRSLCNPDNASANSSSTS